VKLSRKADYALRALFTLTDRWGAGPVSMNELAKKNDVPKRFLEHIMLDLKSQGWVESSPGRNGGYVLAQSPEHITMGQVIRHFEGVLAPIGCVSISNFQPCNQSAACRFRRVLLEVRNLTAEHMDNATLAKVSRNEPVSDEEVFAMEFVEGDGI
jgi:Rrf2 family protein